MGPNLLPHSPYSLDQLEIATYEQGRRTLADYLNYRLDSAFQPIFSLPHRRVVGYEALLRPFDREQNPVSPLDLFGKTRDIAATVYLDRLCRNIHVRNFIRLNDNVNWLFLNVHAEVAMAAPRHAPFFNQLLSRYRLATSRVVIEIVENAISDEGRLAETIHFYKELGCLVAVDDFGAGYSNFNRLWRIRPHIVKFDRALLEQARTTAGTRRLLAGLVGLVHESGSLALLEGIETRAEAALALETGFDFSQGFYFGYPAAGLDTRSTVELNALWDGIEAFEIDRRERGAEELDACIEAFRGVAQAFAAGTPLSAASAQLCRHAAARGCFVLDASGRQVDNAGTAVTTAANEQFAPLADIRGAVWRHREYFRRAIAEPGQIQVTRPYLSGDTASMCVTLSIALSIGGEQRVLCVDLACDAEH